MLNRHGWTLPPVCGVLSRAVRVITISQDLILHGGSGVACSRSFNLERGGKEKEVKVPTTATLTKPLLPGLPSRRGHSPMSKQACGPIVPAAREDRVCLPPGRTERACRRGGQNACRPRGRSACCCGEVSGPAAMEDS